MPKPTINYGIYWDYMYNPLCPSCEKPLHEVFENNDIKLIPKLVCPNGCFNKYLISPLNEKLRPNSIRHEYLKINNIIRD